jgi:DNA invertase Pin-like site-specific DNA recombinase
MVAGVEFLACNQPFASRLTLHILATVAEDEARRISERTRAALQAAKACVRKPGSPLAATLRMRWAHEHSLNDGLRNGKTGGRLNT